MALLYRDDLLKWDMDHRRGTWSKAEKKIHGEETSRNTAFHRVVHIWNRLDKEVLKAETTHD